MVALFHQSTITVLVCIHCALRLCFGVWIFRIKVYYV